MWTWLALLFTPSISLSALGVSYALVPPACNRQSLASLHGLYLVAVLASAVITVMAWAARRNGQAGSRQRFLAAIAGPTGALFTLVTAAQWFAVLMVSPCHT